MSTTAWAGVCALILLVPFEASNPLLQLPGQSISSAETVLFLVFAATAVSMVCTRAIPRWRTGLTWPWALLLGTLFLAAILAPGHRLNAVHMVSRLCLAFGVYLVTVNGVTTSDRLHRVLLAAAVAAAAIAALLVLEYLGFAPVLRTLRLFRPGIAVIGAQVRAGGPFQYPTIASMYLEILFAFVLALVPAALERRRAVEAGLSLVILSVIAEGIILTFTRTGLLTMASSLTIVGSWWYRQRGFDRGVKALAAVALVIVMQVFASHSLEIVRLRLTSESQNSWYHAEVDAPSTLEMTTAGTISVPVTLTNTGRSTWDSSADPPFRFAYHWLLPNEDRVVSWEGARTEFPRPVTSGETVSLDARVQAPGQPGKYRLLWDIEEEHQLWFSSEPDAQLFVSWATVSGPPKGRLASTPLMLLPKKTARPGRLTLWRAGIRMLAAHPILGVGADNFRLLYGGYAGIANADSRVHSNNMYLEVLTAGGIVGGLAFGWFCWRAFRQFAVLIRNDAHPELAIASAGIAAAGVAIALHGLVDSFLSFTATYVLFAITLGLAVACDVLNTRHAYRI